MKAIALVVNSRYAKQTLVFLNSLFASNREGGFILYTINSELKTEEIESMKTISEKYNSQIIDVKVDNNLFAKAPILHPGLSKEAYYKLLVPTVIPQKICRIIYFDVDIIINGNITELFTLDINDYCLGAVADYFVNKNDKEHIKQLGIQSGDYFNSGVIIFNLELIRKDYRFNIAEKYIEENGKYFHFHDQEVLNALFKGKVLFLDEKYNYITKYKGIRDFIMYQLEHNKKKEISVIHYAGIKPWNYSYTGKFYKEFWIYVEESMGLDKVEEKKKRRKKYLVVLLKTIKNVIFIKTK